MKTMIFITAIVTSICTAAMLVVVSLNLIHVAEVSPTIQITANGEEPADLHEFASVEELRFWLRADETNWAGYVIQTHDCDDFAYDLVKNATRDGYFVTLYLDTEAGHLMCAAKIGNSVFIIEPQTDNIYIQIETLDDFWY